MLDNFFEKLRGTDAFRDYFDEATDSVNKAIKSVMNYNWGSLKKYA